MTNEDKVKILESELLETKKLLRKANNHIRDLVKANESLTKDISTKFDGSVDEG